MLSEDGAACVGAAEYVRQRRHRAVSTGARLRYECPGYVLQRGAEIARQAVIVGENERVVGLECGVVPAAINLDCSVRCNVSGEAGIARERGVGAVLIRPADG